MARPANPTVRALPPRLVPPRRPARAAAAALIAAAAVAGLSTGRSASGQVQEQVNRRQPFLQPGDVPDGPGDGRDQNQFVFVRDSAIALEKFNLAMKMERLQEWGKSADLYQEMLEKYRDRVIPAPADEPGGAGGGGAAAPAGPARYTSVTWGVLLKLSRWPQEGLDVYRARFEPKAAELVASAKGDDFGPLYETFQRYFVTESAKKAGMRLIDAALERGEYHAAARIGDQLLDEYPKASLVAERPAVLFRTALAYAMAGDPTSRGKAADRAAALAKDFPKEVGVVRGKDVVLADALGAELKLAAEGAGGAAPVPAGAGDSWPTFGGGPTRNAVSAATANPGTRLYSIPLVRPPLGRGGPQGARQTLQAAYDEAGKAGLNTSVMPVADRGELFFQDGARVYAASLESGVPLPGWLSTYPETGGQYVLRDVSGNTRTAQQTVTVTDRQVLAVMGQPDRQGQMMFNTGAPPQAGEARLVALDRATGKEQWVVQLSTAPDLPKNEDEKAIRALTLTGAPLAVGDSVLVAGRSGRTAQGEDCYVLSFDAATGRFRWACFVASSGVPVNPGYPVPQVGGELTTHLAYADGRVYCVSNVGAVAALDAYGGTIAWLSIYPVDVQPLNVRGMAPPFMAPPAGGRPKPWQVGPPVLADGKLFALPAEGKNLLVYDAATGRELKRISTEKIGRWTGTLAYGHPDRPTTIVGVSGDKLVLAGAVGIGVYDWAKYDEESFADGRDNPQVLWYNHSTVPLAGRPFLTASAVYAAYDDRIARIDMARGDRVTGSLYPPQDQAWPDGEGPGNALVVGDHVVVAGATGVDVYTELALATAKLDREVAAAPAEPELRLRYAEVMYAAGKGDDALARLGEAVGLMGGVERLAGGGLPAGVAAYRDRLFNDALTFAVRGSGDGKAGVDGPAAARERVGKYFDLAAAAAGTPQQSVQYRMARAKYAEQQLRDPAAAAALYQEILSRPESRAVTLSSEDDDAPTQAAEVAERAVAALVKTSGPAVYEPFEQAARKAMAAAAAAATPADKAAGLQAVAEAYPNSTVAPDAMLAAAEAFESAAQPRQAVRVLRQTWFKYPASGRATILEAIARNYLAVPDRNRADMAGTAAARLSMAAQMPGDPKLARDLKLPDGTVVAKAGDAVSSALDAVRKVSSAEASRLLPDFKVPPQAKVRPWVDPFLPPAANAAGAAPAAPALPGAARLVLPARDFARPDRVVTWSPAGLAVFAAGKGMPTAPIAASDRFAATGPAAAADPAAVAPRGVAWAGDAALVWGGSRVACVNAATGKTDWEIDLAALGQLEVIRGGDAGVAEAPRNDPPVVLPNGRVMLRQRVIVNGQVRVLGGPPPAVPVPGVVGGVQPPEPAAPPAPGQGVGEQVAEVRPLGDRALVVSNTGRIVSVDLAGGQVNWQNRLAEQTPDRLVATEDFTVVRASDDVSVRLFALDTFTGRVLGAKAYSRQSAAFPVNLALSAEGTLVYTLPDRLCLKDLYKGWDEEEKVILAGPPGGSSPPMYAGATLPGQLLIAEGRILAVADSGSGMPGMQANEKYVRVHSLETGQPLSLRYTADGTRREVDQILTAGTKDWNVTVRAVGARIYVIGPKTVFGYNLDRPAESWRGAPNMFDADLVDDGNFRDAFVGSKHLVVLDQPTGGNNAAAGAALPPAANGGGTYRLHVFARYPAASLPDKGESGKLDHSVTVTDPAGIAPQWQACDGGFFYATNDGKVRALLGAEQK